MYAYTQAAIVSRTLPWVGMGSKGTKQCSSMYTTSVQFSPGDFLLRNTYIPSFIYLIDYLPLAILN